MPKTVRLALVGLGNVGQAFLDLMVAKADLLADRYDLALVLTGVADSSAAALGRRGAESDRAARPQERGQAAPHLSGQHARHVGAGDGGGGRGRRAAGGLDG